MRWRRRRTMKRVNLRYIVNTYVNIPLHSPIQQLCANNKRFFEVISSAIYLLVVLEINREEMSSKNPPGIRKYQILISGNFFSKKSQFNSNNILVNIYPRTILDTKE
jgi:hypothetical protein